MKRRRWLRRALLAPIFLPLIAAGAGYLWLRSSLPQIEGTLDIAGLAAPVELSRDADGLLHIRAQNESDAYFSLGFAHAQDRLFQMDFLRRLGSGRLSEVLGNVTVGTDKTMRLLGLYRVAEANFRMLAPEVRLALEAYSAGVNAYLDRHARALPLEFHLLRYRPEPWRPADSLVWGRLMAFHLSGNWRDEVLRYRLSRRLTPEQLEFLWPAGPGGGGRSATKDARESPTEIDPATLTRTASALGVLPRPDDASNSWVVGGGRSATGRPLLANDPHLSLTAPIQWYLARIDTPEFSVTGGTAPGVPFTLIGHNGHVAWGFTTTHSDTQDLFVEQVMPDDPTRYRTPEGSRPFVARKETIRVRGGNDVVSTVRATDHGPVVSDIGMGAGLADGPGQVVALAWPGFRADDMTPQALYRMNHAGNAASFRTALRDFHSPQQNILYADRGGAIGFVAAGRVPVRKSLMAGSQTPVPGWTGAYDWTGFLPFDALPQTIDPPAGWIATANNDITPPDYRHFLAARWEEPYRVRRIAELLDRPVAYTADEMTAMQMDVLSLAARDLLPPMLAAARAGRTRHPAALERLDQWDFRVHRGGPEPLIFVTWLREASRRIFSDEMGDLYFEYWSWNLTRVPSVLTSTAPMAATWCEDVSTGANESCPDQFAAALDDAWTALAAAYGDDPARWHWGAAHEAAFPHPVLSRLPVLGDWFTETIETGGSDDTLNRGTARIPLHGVVFPHVHGAGLRAVFDLSDLDRSRFIIAGGQSGNPLSPHYADLIGRWRDGAFLTMVDGTRLGTTDHVLELRPAPR